MTGFYVFVQSVLRCDFLSVAVISGTKEKSDTPPSCATDTPSSCRIITSTSLPTEYPSSKGTTVCALDDPLPNSSASTLGKDTNDNVQTTHTSVLATPTSVLATPTPAPQSLSPASPSVPAPPLEGVSLCAEAYHVVVFSLFLSYLPQPSQRLRSCVKVHQLLRPHGLLLVVTPDSSHQNRRVDMMKSWKASLEKVGFHRCNYSKLTHLHCMAFRKITRETVGLDQLEEALWEGLYIPQDKRQQQHQQDGGESGEGTPEEHTRQLLSDLPFPEIDSD